MIEFFDSKGNKFEGTTTKIYYRVATTDGGYKECTSFFEAAEMVIKGYGYGDFPEKPITNSIDLFRFFSENIKIIHKIDLFPFPQNSGGGERIQVVESSPPIWDNYIV